MPLIANKSANAENTTPKSTFKNQLNSKFNNKEPEHPKQPKPPFKAPNHLVFLKLQPHPATHQKSQKYSSLQRLNQ
jgi:hypothetical protein